MFKRTFGICTVFLLLCSCMSNNMQKASGSIYDTWSPVNFTDPSTLPTSGSAAYNGEMEISSSVLSVSGDLEIVANFATSAVTGQGQNFSSHGGETLAGALDISSGYLCHCADPNTQFTFSASIGGQLTNTSENFSVSGILGGDFKGPNYEAIQGVLSGTIGVAGANHAFVGRFAATR